MIQKSSHFSGIRKETGLIYVDNCYKEPNMHSWGPGSREVYVLHYIISGAGYLEMCGKKYMIEAGDTFLIFPQTEVHYYPEESNPWEYIWVDFRGEEADRIMSITGFSKERPVMRHTQEAEPYFHIYDHQTPSIVKKERYRAKVHLLLTYFIEEKSEINRCKENEYMIAAEEYIANYYWKSGLNVTSIVQHLNIDRTYLYRLFKKTTGISVVQYLIEYRIQKACYLLETTNLSIKSIAYSVGYEDSLYFSRIFHKQMEVSPKDYRNKVQFPLSR